MMNSDAKVISRNGLTATIYWDRDPQDPREWGPESVMVCFHRNYRLGDTHSFSDPEDLRDTVDSPGVYRLPLYLYDHSGITMSTSSFGCRWDSGQVGFIYMTAAAARQRWGWKRITAERRQRILDTLQSEVEVYDMYLTGDVYGYVIEDEDGEELAQCGGFFGLESVEEEVNQQLDYWISKLPQQLELAV